MKRCSCGAPWKEHGGTFETTAGYWSRPGHDHDDNRATRTYTCWAGHATTMFLRKRCPNPNCDWVGRVHGIPSVDEWPDCEDES